jgi:formylglycine-generating enzyme required for sulfatase activity
MNTKINKKFTLTREYWLGETEVTQGQYAAIMDGVINALGESCNPRPSKFTGDDRLPVEEISWYDAKAFCEKLNSLFDGKLPKGYQFDLPTEAQWEFAARGGNISKEYEYSGGNDIEKVAWYWENAGRTTHPVGMKIANELGIYDMSGNVCEWCQDWYGAYSSSSQTNPKGPSNGDNRVNRGGCWFDYARGCRVSNRYDNTPSISSFSLGLRLVL